MQDRFKFRTYIPDLKFFKYWGWIEENHYIGLCPSGDYSMTELLEKYTDQCTGLKDKNGKLIYEGDIVSVLQDENPYVINYSDDRAMFTIENKAMKICCNFDNYWASELEVLGNIYHNKELLNEVGN